MPVDEEKAKEEGFRAFKRRKRLKASTFAPVDVSSEGTQSAKLPDQPITKDKGG